MAPPTRAAARRDRPLLNANFVVELVAGKGSGFAAVAFGPFTAKPATASPSLALAPVPLADRVVLSRGATGAPDLYHWWRQARDGQAPPRRTVTVKLLADDHSTVLMTWRLRNAKPVALAYSPLDALEGAVLMETIELAFDDVEITSGA